MILDTGRGLQAGEDNRLRITAVDHDASGPLRAGARLLVSVRGTAGATATFTIAGATPHIEMQETQAGIYQGAYSARKPVNIRNGAVVGWLRRDREAAFATAVPVTIDTIPPQVTRRFPAPGETVRVLRPGIVISVADPGGTGVDFENGRLIVNGQDVTHRTSWARTGIGYSPRVPLTGAVTVQLVVPDLAGNVTSDNYVFYVGAGPEGR